MTANKVPRVFAAVAQDPFCAALAQSHSNTNALCLGAKIVGSALLAEIVRVWMSTEWLGVSDEKYARRVAKVVEIDAGHVS